MAPGTGRVDERLVELTIAVDPVIVPDTIIVDRGKVFVPPASPDRPPGRPSLHRAGFEQRENGVLPLRQRWNRRLEVLGEDPLGDPHRPSEPRIEVATYPEVIVLTGLFTSPHRLGHPQLPAEAARRFRVAQTQLGPGLVRKPPPSLRILEQGVSPP
ncbi:hypothetical protein [Streptomyces sp. NPDC002403]